MLGLIQRVARAEVRVESEVIGRIGPGILLLLGVQKGDSAEDGKRLLNKVINYRIFPDDDDKMNRSLLDVAGGLLVVSQFTLAADTRKGLRPSFSSAGAPAEAEQLYEQFLAAATRAEDQGIQVASGRFAANMQVSLLNDGPVTFLLES